MPARPVVKFSIAGTRPKAESAKKVIAAAAPVGSITPTFSPVRVPRLQRRAQRETGAQDVVIGQRPVVAIHQRDTVAAMLQPGFDQSLKYRAAG